MNTTYLKPEAMVKALKTTLKAKQIPFVRGEPGVGKTALIEQVAEEIGLKVINLNLATADAQDFNGLVDYTDNRTKAHYVPFDVLPVEGTPLPIDDEGNTLPGWLLFLDEMPAAKEHMQTPLLKLFQERLVGNKNLHDKVYIVTAGNNKSDRASVNTLNTALISRIVELHFVCDAPYWLDYASSVGAYWAVQAWIEQNPRQLQMFDPTEAVHGTFRSPRTWMMVSKLQQAYAQPMKRTDPVAKALVEGAIGVAGATEYMAFTEMTGRLPTRQQIIDTPDAVSWENDLAITSLMTYLVIDIIAEEQNCTPYLNLLLKLPVAFQIIAVRGVNSRASTKLKSQLSTDPRIKEWRQNLAMSRTV